MEPSEEVHLLCAHHNGLLPEGSFKIAPVRAPPFAIELVRHDLKHDNVVPLGPAWSRLVPLPSCAPAKAGQP